MPSFKVQCCIGGGGPAGMMLGYLLARAGVTVAVLEKHQDFLRDFRGDTIHPSTLELMHELGILEDFLKLPHQKLPLLAGRVGGEIIPIADFRHLPTVCRFIAFMPQWDFLNFLAARAAAYPGFHLLMATQATGLITQGERVTGIRARKGEEDLEICADLVVGADGRHSTLRPAAGLQGVQYGAPMDVLWFRLSRQESDPGDTMGTFVAGRIFIAIDRGEHWQCAFVIPKGAAEETRSRGLEAFKREVATLAPTDAQRVEEIVSWDDVKLLSVQIDRLSSWHRPGLLCIGDAAHAMSPVGGVGINLAVQDAVAAANVLVPAFRRGTIEEKDLAAVQARREWPTRFTQGLQIAIQKRVISRVLADRGTLKPPFILRMLQRIPYLRRLPARLIGLGVRPEHVAPAIAKAEGVALPRRSA